MDDKVDVKIKKARFAAGTRGGSDRKAWMKKLRMESHGRAEVGDEAGTRGCKRNSGLVVDWTWSELGAWKSTGYLSAMSGTGDPYEVPPTGMRRDLGWHNQWNVGWLRKGLGWRR